VRLLGGRAALVAGNRTVQRGGGATELLAETRLWEYTDGIWKQAHFHRSAATAAAPPDVLGSGAAAAAAGGSA